ncbi:muramoyltetrapeptide carboxypeptidase [bacterium M00.F.Ca.ET.228.01.1.1]|uniref:muramoyltetrapeptide carboxypeptidase n=1 Tax=Paraburkholderia phenoliruptrix TaxID=252970 RepID=UPI001091A33B|nr:muramoyltetrapeptide carboxypeptidase [Paraburkholderia phenoliruptrix]TGP42326.1 muramoyltetrapeptide carboxypeptidase [bacterium M00.F.Ca.ET.228.01.1.1]TGR99975.1 muramoyltetrapeptide carboxypeptidase [bacterium M00.F.Ca.ET.191.01.1.1]TGU04296.1 muramoyltetrapeptide carboxypeptidase [bacterium M00.F.Ca.ET.155.01.1.1]MBW0451163.1 muramoyltetrapeptide carboxypeptidase [Paraburkholderia phenoliruptrix]MBW9102000.1 muramoyltetrapeptide carboxypeptidase [Paraburkholderia phenoliruptrix]
MTTHRTFDLIAPSGYPHDAHVLNRALQRLRTQGHRVEGVEVTQRRYQRFGGTDGERAADLNRLADPSRPLPDVVLAVRGGYGAVRILHGLDYDGLQRRLSAQPVALVGHSDFTAVQLALLARAGLKSFSGPMLMSDFGAENVSEFTMHHFWSALTQPTVTISRNVPQAHAVDVSGTLWGGNLAVLTSLVGTPYMPPVQGGVLFVEDVNEQPFRIERMLYQLHLSGILDQQQALVLGDFSGGKPFDYDNGYDLQAMIEQMRSVIGIPIVTGLQFGHVPDMLTLPVGADAHLVADANGFRLTLSNYPCLR